MERLNWTERAAQVPGWMTEGRVAGVKAGERRLEDTAAEAGQRPWWLCPNFARGGGWGGGRHSGSISGPADELGGRGGRREKGRHPGRSSWRLCAKPEVCFRFWEREAWAEGGTDFRKHNRGFSFGHVGAEMPIVIQLMISSQQLDMQERPTPADRSLTVVRMWKMLWIYLKAEN